MHAEKCPVCGGNGLVPAGFYLSVTGKNSSLSDASPETCRSCNGNGYIEVRDEPTLVTSIPNKFVTSERG